jgi:hypothetical protein
MALTLLLLPWSLLVTSRLVLLMALLVLLGLGAALLVSLLVKRRDEVLEGSDEVNSEISLGFMGFLDRFGDILDGCGEAFERGMNAFEARGDSFEKFHLRVVV